MDWVGEHLVYVSDPARIEAYRSAVARAVRDGILVADVGCGTGVLGLMCLQAGAARVYAIDSTSMIDVARTTFSNAGLLERVVFTRSPSARTVLPERVDLVICDQVGYFGFDAGIVQCYADARRRFLKPGGMMIPARLRLYAAPVESANSYRQVASWEEDPVPPALRWVAECAANTRHAVRFKPAELLGPPVRLGEIDLYADDARLFSWNASLPIERSGTLHGIAGWFECELAPGVWMTNSPLAERPIQRPQALLPIREAATVNEGESLTVSVIAKPRDEILAWVVETTSGRRFSQSTWHSAPLVAEQIERADADRVPRRNREGLARLTVLGYCDGRRTAREIEELVLLEHPDLFPSPEESSRFVVDVLQKDAE